MEKEDRGGRKEEWQSDLINQNVAYMSICLLTFSSKQYSLNTTIFFGRGSSTKVGRFTAVHVQYVCMSICVVCG